MTETWSVSDRVDVHNVIRNDFEIRVGILTVSDTCSQGLAKDLSGDFLDMKSNSSHWKVVRRKCIPDNCSEISMTLTEWCDTSELDVIFTTGGTGLAVRDVTPEATKAILDKETPGISVALMVESLKITPMAMLSRLTSGIRGLTLVINFPGSPKACGQCFDIVKPVIKHAIDLLKSHMAPMSYATAPRMTSKVVTQVARRNRQSPYELFTVDEAQNKVLKLVHEMPVTKKKLKDALGFVIAEDIRAVEPFPPFRASIKDGYAVIASDGIGTRKVVSCSLAGIGDSHTDAIKSGECVRITTGAPIPKGADAVVQVEDTELLSEGDHGETEIVIEITKPPLVKQDIREIGSDIKKDEIIVRRGMILTSGVLGVLATAGHREIPVIKKPRVAVLSTGDELQPPDDTLLQPGKIRDSNKTTLLTLLEENGFSASDSGIAIDQPDVILTKIHYTLQNVDVLITTGGVSMGERDLIAEVLLEDLNAALLFGRLKMKPGKPTKVFHVPGFDGPKYVFALPGNPVSAMVTCHLFVLPALRAMSGWQKPLPMLFKVKVPEDIELDERYEYARAFLIWNVGDDVPTASLTGNQISSRLMSMVEADCLLHLPAATPSMKVLRSGTIVNAQLINRNLMRGLQKAGEITEA